MDKEVLSHDDREKVMSQIHEFDKVLGVLFPEKAENLSDEITALIKEREEARKSKDWKKSDEIRDQLLSQGIILEDTPKGTVWKRG
jgi:cysteinyl-tRNA synthetase